VSVAVVKAQVHETQRSRLADAGRAGSGFPAIVSDHMLTAEHRDGEWQAPVIAPYAPLPLAPSISALQYGVSVFEGLKAQRAPDGSVLLFRPWDNARRLNRSAARLAMPEVPEALFLEGIRDLVRLDRDWVPENGAGALYIRPCFFSIDESVRVKPADRFLFVVFTFPFGSYFAVPLDVLVTERYVRAFPGGTGDVKPGGNYAAGMLAERLARDAGFHTVMWLDGVEHRYVEECGVTNVFFVLGDEVVTPELSGTILAGITRDSVLTLLREAGHTVRERRVSIDEIVEAHDRGDLRECFGVGTAATLTPVRRIRYRERDLVLPAVEEQKIGAAVRARLVAIASGLETGAHGWIERL